MYEPKSIIKRYQNIKDKRVVLLQSGGLDSNICAALFHSLGFEVEHVFIDYSQNSVNQERKCAKAITHKYSGTLHEVSLCLPWLLKTKLVSNTVDDWEADGALNTIDAGTYVPLRNAMFLNVAASLAESEKIPYIAAALDGAQNLLGTPTGGTTDKHPKFVNSMQKAINEGSAYYHCSNHRKHFKVLTPIMGMYKTEIILLGQAVNADLSLSWSCYNNSEEPCMKCSACRARSEAFEYLKLNP